MGYTSGFTSDEYDELRDILRDLGGRTGDFDANEATGAIVQRRVVDRAIDVSLANLGDILTVLQDMVDLGYLEEIERDPPDGPSRWRYVER